MTDIANQKHRLLTRGSTHDRHDACDMLDALAKERDELAALVKYLEGVGEVDGKLIQKTVGDAVRYKGQAEKAEAEVERLRVAARMARARTTDSAVAYALDAALQRKEGNE